MTQEYEFKVSDWLSVAVLATLSTTGSMPPAYGCYLSYLHSKILKVNRYTLKRNSKWTLFNFTFSDLVLIILK